MQNPLFLWNALPNDTVGEIYQFCDSETRKTLSLVNSEIYEVGREITQGIVLHGPCKKPDFRNIPDRILVNILERYPNIKKLTFGCHPIFGPNDAKYLSFLIEYLSDQKKNALIKGIKKLTFFELNESVFKLDDFNKCTLNTYINKRLLDILCPKNLEILKIKINSFSSVVDLYQSTFDRFNLKKLSIKPVRHPRERWNRGCNLLLDKQTNLKSLKINEFKISLKTFESLLSCKKLEIFDFESPWSMNEYDCNADNIQIFNSICLNKSFPWKLKKLSPLGAFGDKEFEIMLKKFPEIECLSIYNHHISNKCYDLVGKYCSNLRELSMGNLCKFELTSLSSHNLQNLKLLDISALELTNESYLEIAKNCSSLRILLSGAAIREEQFMETLSANCLNLQALQINLMTINYIQDIKDYVKKNKSLKYLELCGEQSIWRDFYKANPHLIEDFPDNFSLKHLPKLKNPSKLIKE